MLGSAMQESSVGFVTQGAHDAVTHLLKQTRFVASQLQVESAMQAPRQLPRQADDLQTIEPSDQPQVASARQSEAVVYEAQVGTTRMLTPFAGSQAPKVADVANSSMNRGQTGLLRGKAVVRDATAALLSRDASGYC